MGVKSLKFRNYAVNNLNYDRNVSFNINDAKKGTRLNNPVKFKSDINYSLNNGNAIINIDVKTGDIDDPNSPFICNVNISGVFEFEFDEDDKKNKNDKEVKKMLALNGNAILFPYIRSVVSNLTLMSNQFPAYILPTFNFVDYLEKHECISFNNVDANN